MLLKTWLDIIFTVIIFVVLFINFGFFILGTLPLQMYGVFIRIIYTCRVTKNHLSMSKGNMYVTVQTTTRCPETPRKTKKKDRQ